MATRMPSAHFSGRASAGGRHTSPAAANAPGGRVP
jgi:hypothetical protein